MASKIPEKALNLIRNMPRVKLNSLKPLPGEYTIGKKRRRNRHSGFKSGRGDKGQGQRMTLPRIGFEGGNTPFYLRIPKEPYYKGHHVRREYPPFSLLQLQRMIDTGRIDINQPIDLTTICNTHIYKINPMDKEFGVNLTDEGAEIFTAKINIEVQWAEESTIAAIERNGGMITTRYFSSECVEAMCNPLKFFSRGIPIPRCPLPPENAFEYYTNPDFRGYLADPEKVKESRFKLAQKYGYEMPNYDEDLKKELFEMRKDPRQIYFGLSPGWIVCLKDKVIIKPKDPEYEEFYQS
ncbi:39S ribosomal protein L15, mitochondrial-like [Mercenaria mercenaria]|uniref:39S ribosomal protein L15, mitochondrial-like n=1 Tax=Mercenaria mercenaria TaxID=6596 RepID=UPI001E1DC1D5|nr:39S ribosomal protein L15, mitochondrial-like [Mercenaria mercenaria]